MTDKLRIVHFDSLNLTEVRQTNPLPDPPQPPGGYRLVYWLLDGDISAPPPLSVAAPQKRFSCERVSPVQELNTSTSDAYVSRADSPSLYMLGADATHLLGPKQT